MGRILVTGGCGFIGSHLVDLLASKGHKVVILDALSYGANVRNVERLGRDAFRIVGGLTGQRVGGLPDADCVLVIGDVADADLVKDLVDRTDACFHLAAQSHVDRSYGDVRPFVDSNVVGSYSVLEAFRGHPSKRLVFVSTDEVYGDKESGFSMEGDPLAPRNIYSTLKAGADLLAQTYAAIYGVNLVIARPANNYGPRQFAEKLIPKIVTTFMAGGKVPVYGEGDQVRDWLYVKDTVRALVHLYESASGGSIYNLGAHQFRTVLDVVRAIGELLKVDWRSRIEHVPDRIRGDRRYALDLSRMHRDFGWKAETTFADGIKETVDWYVTEFVPEGT